MVMQSVANAHVRTELCCKSRNTGLDITLSTADFYTERNRKKSRFYEIERVVSRTVGKEKVSESALLRVFD